MDKIAQAVMQVPRVAQTPPPRVLLSNMNETGYLLEITWWLADPENGRLNSISDVNLAAWRVLREFHVDLFAVKASENVNEEQSIQTT